MLIHLIEATSSMKIGIMSCSTWSLVCLYTYGVHIESQGNYCGTDYYWRRSFSISPEISSSKVVYLLSVHSLASFLSSIVGSSETLYACSTLRAARRAAAASNDGLYSKNWAYCCICMHNLRAEWPIDWVFAVFYSSSKPITRWYRSRKGIGPSYKRLKSNVLIIIASS